MFLVPNIDQMYKEMKKIVEVGNKHGNGDEFYWNLIFKYKFLLCIFCTKKLKEEFEETKGVIRIRKSKKDIQNNDQKKKDKQRSTKHYTAKINYMNPTKNWGTNEWFSPYGRHHDLVNRYGISVAQMTTDMLHLS
jgi:hypothetical protein